jgi:hypothetical protein
VFRNLFLVLVSGSYAPATHADELSTTTIAPVRSVSEAVSAVSSYGPVDLIELYGGLGHETAAAVLSVAPNVPVGFPGAALPPAAAGVLFEDPTPARWHFGSTTVATVPSAAEAPAMAASLVAAGAERIELCGGMGPIPAAAVAQAVNVPVTTVLFGFESLPHAAAYRTRYEASL